MTANSMPSRSRRRQTDLLIPALALTLDAAAVEVAFLFSYWLRFNTHVLRFLPLMEDVPPLDAYLYSSSVVIVVWLAVFHAAGMYGARRNIALPDEFVLILRRVTFGMLIVMGAAFFYREFSYSRVVFILLWGTSILFLFLGRALLSRIERSLYAHGRELRNAVIIGNNETADRIYRTLLGHPLLGYRLVGYVADAPCSASGGLSLAGAAFLGELGETPAILANHGIELAIISLGSSRHPEIHSLMQGCEGMSVEFLLVPDIIELMSTGVSVAEIEGIPFIKIKGLPMSAWGRIVKRTFDILVSALMLVLGSPVFLLAAILIRLESKGPVFYRQERVGMDGERFSMIKFRSMSVAAEEKTGPVWASENDPRRTKVGSVLRKTSIDELPQLVNVLKGEMSLVGPRPERPHFVEQFTRRDASGKSTVPMYRDRHRVRTGMTGWAQVNGLRGNTSLNERIKFDIYYVENWSIGFDIRILFKTIKALFVSKNSR